VTESAARMDWDLTLLNLEVQLLHRGELLAVKRAKVSEARHVETFHLTNLNLIVVTSPRKICVEMQIPVIGMEMETTVAVSRHQSLRILHLSPSAKCAEQLDCLVVELVFSVDQRRTVDALLKLFFSCILVLRIYPIRTYIQAINKSFSKSSQYCVVVYC